MDCGKQLQRSVKIDERSVREQEHRKINRLWEKAVKKHSSTTIVTAEDEEAAKKGVRFRSASPHSNTMGEPCKTDPEEEEEGEPAVSPIALQRRMAKMKTFAKRKSPLQKFDDIVTRELINRHNAENDSSCSFDVQNWPSNLDFSCSKISTTGRKVTFDTRLSKTTLQNVDREMQNKDKDPSDIENAALMEAIERLIQAQASCQFDAMVKAAEAATSMVPPEKAEEVAVACAKDYQSKIIDIVSEKFAAGDGQKPVEVIGYIGLTNRKKDSSDDE